MLIVLMSTGQNLRKDLWGVCYLHRTIATARSACEETNMEEDDWYSAWLLGRTWPSYDTSRPLNMITLFWGSSSISPFEVGLHDNVVPRTTTITLEVMMLFCCHLFSILQKCYIKGPLTQQLTEDTNVWKHLKGCMTWFEWHSSHCLFPTGTIWRI